jgi:hypothetical protein
VVLDYGGDFSLVVDVGRAKIFCKSLSMLLRVISLLLRLDER